MRPVGWDIGPARLGGPGRRDEIIDRVYAGASAGSIVLLHDRADCAATVEALPAIVNGLRDLGLRLVTVSAAARPGSGPTGLSARIVHSNSAPACAAAIPSLTRGAPSVRGASSPPQSATRRSVAASRRRA